MIRYAIQDPYGCLWQASNFWTEFADSATLFCSETMAWRQCCHVRRLCTDEKHAENYRTVRIDTDKDFMTIKKGTD